MDSLFAKFGSIRFWPKTMHYSKAFLIIVLIKEYKQQPCVFYCVLMLQVSMYI